MTIRVTDLNNEIHELSLTTDALHLMDLISSAGIAIRAECGGGGICATCHIYIDKPGAGGLDDASSDEEDTMDMAYQVQSTSRLACQIPVTEKLSGMELTLAPNWP